MKKACITMAFIGNIGDTPQHPGVYYTNYPGGKVKFQSDE
jgi:hypothetical protein